MMLRWRAVAEGKKNKLLLIIPERNFVNHFHWSACFIGLRVRLLRRYGHGDGSGKCGNFYERFTIPPVIRFSALFRPHREPCRSQTYRWVHISFVVISDPLATVGTLPIRIIDHFKDRSDFYANRFVIVDRIVGYDILCDLIRIRIVDPISDILTVHV